LKAFNQIKELALFYFLAFSFRFSMIMRTIQVKANYLANCRHCSWHRAKTRANSKEQGDELVVSKLETGGRILANAMYTLYTWWSK